MEIKHGGEETKSQNMLLKNTVSLKQTGRDEVQYNFVGFFNIIA